jgi:outer membrane protein OmpA-like peptidoglycan-associated protein
MRARIGFAPLALAVLLAANAATAEPLGSHFTVTPVGGFTLFDGEFRLAQDGRFPGKNPLTDDLYAGARVGYEFNRWLGFELAGGFTPTQVDTVNGDNVDFMHYSGNIMLTPWNQRYGGPFLFAGGGFAQFKPSTKPPSRDGLDQGVVEFGGGVRMWLTDAVGLRLEARNIMWIPGSSSVPKRQYLMLGGGLTFGIGGRPRDTDGDGVPDRRDKCPNTPRGAKVDANGCPIDNDGDGVYDGLDACPGTPRGCTVDAKGCPSDQDADGVCDGLDKCADTPKGADVDANGCPKDSDGDGVLDGLDKCPGTPKGCTVDANGCPADQDGDGVCDGLDKCPNTPAGAKVDADGCPIEVIERETEMLDTGMIRLQNVNFETGKANLLSESFPTLDIVGQVLGKWPELKIEIGGHTDSRGSDAANHKLSQARADSVLSYLMQKFPALKAEQFSVKGYGESKPVAPNTNALNMAKNRRVEFVVTNKDVLKRESERRRLLQKSETPPPVTPAPADTTKK